MSKVAKTIRKGVSKLWKGIKKTFRKAWDNKYVRAAIIGAVVFFGGAALGMWNSPFASVNGAFVGGAGTSTSGTILAGGDVAGSMVAGAETATSAAKLGSLVGAESATLGAAGTAATTTVPTLATGEALATMAKNPAYFQTGKTAAQLQATRTAGTVASKGLIGTIGNGAKAVGSFMKEYPLPSAMMVNAAAGLTSPDEIDILRERDELDRKRRERNLDVSGIDLGFINGGGRRQLTDMSGRPVYGSQGLIQSNLMGRS